MLYFSGELVFCLQGKDDSYYQMGWTGKQNYQKSPCIGPVVLSERGEESTILPYSHPYPLGHLAMSRDCYNGGGILLAHSRQKAGMLLSILQCMGWLPTTKNYQHRMSTVPRLRQYCVSKQGNTPLFSVQRPELKRVKLSKCYSLIRPVK